MPGIFLFPGADYLLQIIFKIAAAILAVDNASLAITLAADF